MADWYGTARSNYFRVKDVDAFRKLCKLWNITFIIDGSNPARVGFLCHNNNGGLPDYRYEDSESGEEFDFDDFLSELAALLMDDEVAVMVEAGAEKMRYVTACAIAINSKGDKCSISLDEIYERAKAIGKNIMKAER
jgi:hypothetical protein